jgi:hypothetical protein
MSLPPETYPCAPCLMVGHETTALMFVYSAPCCLMHMSESATVRRAQGLINTVTYFDEQGRPD